MLKDLIKTIATLTLILFFTCNLFAQDCNSQTVLSGQVVTNWTVPVEGARVTYMSPTPLGSYNVKTLTDQTGWFRFENVPPCQQFVVTVEYPRNLFFTDTRVISPQDFRNLLFVGTVDSTTFNKSIPRPKGKQ